MQVKIRFYPSHDTVSFSSMHGWAKWIFIMMLGSDFGRSFYYLGIPPAKIFIGEIVLVLVFVFRPRELCDRWTSFLIRPSAFGPFAWCLLFSILYGVFEVVYGLSAGYSLLTALQNLVFNIYPIYFFLGVWAGRDYPTLFQKIIRYWAWTLAIYGQLICSFCTASNSPCRVPTPPYSVSPAEADLSSSCYWHWSASLPLLAAHGGFLQL